MAQTFWNKTFRGGGGDSLAISYQRLLPSSDYGDLDRTTSSISWVPYSSTVKLFSFICTKLCSGSLCAACCIRIYVSLCYSELVVAKKYSYSNCLEQARRRYLPQFLFICLGFFKRSGLGIFSFCRSIFPIKRIHFVPICTKHYWSTLISESNFYFDLCQKLINLSRRHLTHLTPRLLPARGLNAFWD